ncbi:MAG: hypothetical protein AB1405_18625, partial [Bdellovibrionota bacterium]
MSLQSESPISLDAGVSERELSLMPQGYNARANEARVAAHLSLITSHPGYPFKDFRKNPLSFRLTPGLAAHRLLTFSMNSPYALVQATAAIAANGGSIQSAELFPRSDGTLLMEIDFTKAGLPQFESIEETLTRYFSSYTAPPQPAGL